MVDEHGDDAEDNENEESVVARPPPSWFFSGEMRFLLLLLLLLLLLELVEQKSIDFELVVVAVRLVLDFESGFAGRFIALICVDRRRRRGGRESQQARRSLHSKFDFS